jgi:rhamnogalacturonyl hydrolase YesR
MKTTEKIIFIVFLTMVRTLASTVFYAQTGLDSAERKSVPLYRLPPAYPIPYGKPSVENIREVLSRILIYLESETPTKLIDSKTGVEITDFTSPNPDAELQKGDLPLISYEWGVTYAGMLQAGEVLGDDRFTEYTRKRLAFIHDVAKVYSEFEKKYPGISTPVQSVLHPRALDDAGSMCAAMIKAERAKVNNDLRFIIDNYISYISNNEYRMDDGTLARQGPFPNTLWLDDLFMSVPALAQMGKLTGDKKYFDDAVKQVLQFSDRMFNTETGLFMHGWAKEMNIHPEFRWARANGWAIMAIVELLDVLPEDHPGRDRIVNILQLHIRGLAACQSGSGFWHQLLDRPDSYLETSATAIYTYSIARAINRGYVSASVYGPMVLLAWNAISTRVNETGQVEGTCVGTGMGFDPAFYYYRPQSELAAHGYGPVLLAGSEIISLLKNYDVETGQLSVQVYEKK